MTLRLDDFKAQLRGGGSRSNLFQITINFPRIVRNAPSGASVAYMAKSGSMPGSTIGEIAVPFRGRKMYVAGDREYETWDVTFINDVDMVVRNALESWHEGISAAVANIGPTDPSQYYADMKVEHLDKAGRKTKTYNLVDAWPTAISAIDLSFDNENAIEEFSATFRYHYYTTS